MPDCVRREDTSCPRKTPFAGRFMEPPATSFYRKLKISTKNSWRSGNYRLNIALSFSRERFVGAFFPAVYAVGMESA